MARIGIHRRCPLSQLIPASGFDWPEALNYFRLIAPAVAHAHEKGILHRDLKPGNVLIGHDGTLKVAGFGPARPIAERVLSFSLTMSSNVAARRSFPFKIIVECEKWTCVCLKKGMFPPPRLFLSAISAASLNTHISRIKW
jgi:serine/threonine protein kinase